MDWENKLIVLCVIIWQIFVIVLCCWKCIFVTFTEGAIKVPDTKTHLLLRWMLLKVPDAPVLNVTWQLEWIWICDIYPRSKEHFVTIPQKQISFFAGIIFAPAENVTPFHYNLASCQGASSLICLDNCLFHTSLSLISLSENTCLLVVQLKTKMNTSIGLNHPPTHRTQTFRPAPGIVGHWNSLFWNISHKIEPEY